MTDDSDTCTARDGPREASRDARHEYSSKYAPLGGDSRQLGICGAPLSTPADAEHFAVDPMADAALKDSIRDFSATLSSAAGYSEAAVQQIARDQPAYKDAVTLETEIRQIARNLDYALDRGLKAIEEMRRKRQRLYKHAYLRGISLPSLEVLVANRYGKGATCRRRQPKTPHHRLQWQLCAVQYVDECVR